MSTTGIQYDSVKIYRINIFGCCILLFRPHLVPHAVVTASSLTSRSTLPRPLLFFTHEGFIRLDSGVSNAHDRLRRPVLHVDSVRFGPYSMSNLFSIISRTSFRRTSQRGQSRRVCRIRAHTRHTSGAAFIPSVGLEASVNRQCLAESYR